MGRMRIRGFLIKHRVTTLFRRVFRRTPTHLWMSQPPSIRAKTLDRVCSWTRRLKARAKAMISKNLEPGRGYIQLGSEKPVHVPKGHLAVYVGQKDGEFERVFVPVVYFNHPLFGNLLRESEKEYGFDHTGGITIPCRVAEFERVQSRIKAGQCTRSLLGWKRSGRSLMG